MRNTQFESHVAHLNKKPETLTKSNVGTDAAPSRQAQSSSNGMLTTENTMYTKAQIH